MTTVNGILVETINDKSDLGAGIAYDDFVAVWDVSAGNTRKVSRTNFLGAALADGTISGGGAIVTGGFTLTIPATGTAALREAANTFTDSLTVAGAGKQIVVSSGDNGAGAGGQFAAYRNSNASTPAPGVFVCQEADGSYSFLYPDNSGVWRTYPGAVTNATMGSGTVVGSQTSSLDTKDVLGEMSSIEDVLAAVQKGAEAVRRFTYKSGAFGGEEFEGVVVDFAPRYGFDRDDEHPAGKALNMINAIGDLLRAVAWLVEREQTRG